MTYSRSTHKPALQMATAGMADDSAVASVHYEDTRRAFKHFQKKRGMAQLGRHRGGTQDYKFAMFRKIQAGKMPAATARAILADAYNAPWIEVFEKEFGPIEP